MQMQEPSALGRIVELVRDLRRRCPWDGAQTPQSLRPYLVEEALELDEALASGDPEAIRVELGDVMLHVAFQIVLGEETGAYGAEDVTAGIERKMWQRHPHLFANAPPPESWEQTKRDVHPRTRSVLDGLPPGLPALIMASRLQERAAGVGFDWPDAEGPRAKVREEVEELESEVEGDNDSTRIQEEIGDLLFSVVNLARKLGVDARLALEQANTRFVERFSTVERLAKERNIEMGNAGLETLDALWEEAKTT